MIEQSHSRRSRARDWAVVNTQPHREPVARDHLRRQGFEVYCPLMRRRRTHARRVENVLRPLFPGYLFVHVEEERTRWRPILSTVGVRALVRFGDRLALLDKALMQSLRAREVDGVIARPAMPYRVGQRVRLDGGPFDGVVATILSLDEKDRLVVLMELLQRGVQARVTTGQVIPA
jgi:transcription elongation factor/antiterminator RfaH